MGHLNHIISSPNAPILRSHYAFKCCRLFLNG